MMTIREYGRTELAMLYFPHIEPGSAWRKLRNWIELDPALASRLKKSGYQQSSQRHFTPNQVRLIMEHIGWPSDTI